MDLTPVSDLNDPRLEIYKTLRGNARDGRDSFVADSEKVVTLLLRTELRINSILATRDFYEKHAALLRQKEIPILFVAEKKTMQSIVGHKLHQGVMMHGIRPQMQSLEALDDTVLMLDRVANMENVGAIARSMAALDVRSMAIAKEAPHPYGRRALRVSMGYASKLKIHVYEDMASTITRFKEAGYTVFGAEATEDAIPLTQLQIPRKWVVVLGHEGYGLSPETLSLCDATLRIEMAPDVKSFNITAAAALVMHRFQTQNGAL